VTPEEPMAAMTTGPTLHAYAVKGALAVVSLQLAE